MPAARRRVRGVTTGPSGDAGRRAARRRSEAAVARGRTSTPRSVPAAPSRPGGEPRNAEGGGRPDPIRHGDAGAGPRGRSPGRRVRFSPFVHLPPASGPGGVGGPGAPSHPTRAGGCHARRTLVVGPADAGADRAVVVHPG